MRPVIARHRPDDSIDQFQPAVFTRFVDAPFLKPHFKRLQLLCDAVELHVQTILFGQERRVYFAFEDVPVQTLQRESSNSARWKDWSREVELSEEVAEPANEEGGDGGGGEAGMARPEEAGKAGQEEAGKAGQEEEGEVGEERADEVEHV